MGMYVYQVCKGMKLLAEGVDELGWWIDPKTGLRLENATYISDNEEARRGYAQHELKGSSIYTYELRLEYSLELECQGGDWHDVLAAMVGFDRDNPDAYPADGPFIELLHNDYSMATFGPSVARKLVADFDAWNDRASKPQESLYDDEFYLTYWGLRACFAHAATNGVVRCNWQMP